MYSFDEEALADELAALPQRQQVAFAAAAATRQLDSYEWYARRFNPDALSRAREIAAALWSVLEVDEIDRDAWSATLEEVMALLPEEGDDWIICHALAEDALASLAYALRTLLEAQPQEAAWAARRGYEAVDQAAIRLLDVEPGSAETELAILSHAIVQRELSRQRRDIDTLVKQPGADAATALRRLAADEPSLSPAELALLV